MCSVLIPEKSEQFFVFLSDIFKIGEAPEGRYCFTRNRGKELRKHETTENMTKYKKY